MAIGPVIYKEVLRKNLVLWEQEIDYALTKSMIDPNRSDNSLTAIVAPKGLTLDIFEEYLASKYKKAGWFNVKYNFDRLGNYLTFIL